MKSFRSTLTAWILVLAMAWTGIFSASGFCTVGQKKRIGGVFHTAAYRAQKIPLQGLIPSRENSSLLTTTAPNAPSYACELLVRLCQNQADAAHPSLGHHLTPRAIIYGYDGLHHPASEPKQLAGTGMDFADTKPEGQRLRMAMSSQAIAASPEPLGVIGVAGNTYDNDTKLISQGSSVGPNMYAYVVQNPWSSFDTEGLAEFKPSWARVRHTLDSGSKWLARPVKAAAAIAVVNGVENFP